MNSFSKKQIIITSILTLFIILGLFFLNWLRNLNESIDQQLLKKQFTPSIELFSAPEKFFRGQIISLDKIVNSFKIRRYRERDTTQILQNKDYVLYNKEQCESLFSSNTPEDIFACVAFRNSEGKYVLLTMNEQSTLIEVFEGSPLAPATLTELDPMVFAQYYGSEPILRSIVELGDTPPLCLNALLAIEDSTFLEHKGISLKSIARAFVKNLSAGRVVQGGSTITQQLVKNYFLTHERKFSRKFKEFFMAMLLETKSTKDGILEAYINEVYMGQNGPFQIHGFSSAAEYYFGKKLQDLSLSECALMAALVNGPGIFSPFTNPEKALERRKLVLEKMSEQKIISTNEFAQASEEPLPTRPQKLLSEPAPFFVDAVMKQLKEMGFDLSMGLKIETTLDLQAQEAAQKSLREGLDKIENSYQSLQNLKKSGKNLEGLVVSADPTNGYIQAIVGGRNFKKSQFNRAIQSKRQVGSIMKPFVFLTALDSPDANGGPYTPLSLLDDIKFTTEYDKQKWSPDNYEDQYFGKIPMYFALTRSLNSATAQLGMTIGLDNVIRTTQLMGVVSSMKPFPALTLGAFELSPLEVLEAYGTLARLGEHNTLTMIRKIKSVSNEILFETSIVRDQAIDPSSVAVVVGMLKQTILQGTARGVLSAGFNHPTAGKTGTTNDKKDSWFAGFTPLHVAVVWVGYDDNTPHGLTGSQAALPIWTQYMKDYAGTFPPIDFNWPENTEIKTIDVDTQKSLGVPETPDRPLSDFELVFKKE